jgi:hypothetical protein
MAIKYYHATNTGKGFITHDDNESAHIAGHPGELWTTENTAWASRVSATEKTFAEAQALVSASLDGQFHTSGPNSGSAKTYSLPEA